MFVPHFNTLHGPPIESSMEITGNLISYFQVGRPDITQQILVRVSRQKEGFDQRAESPTTAYCITLLVLLQVGRGLEVPEYHQEPPEVPLVV